MFFPFGNRLKVIETSFSKDIDACLWVFIPVGV
jgi:hypothetical protein